MKNIFRRISVLPFQGLYPKKSLAKAIISPPYDVLTTIEAKKLVESKENLFLHVIKPEIDFPESHNPYSTETYSKGAKNLESFIDQNWLIKDTIPRFYLYQINSKNHSQTGFLAATSVKEYEEGLIKPHELTREIKVNDRKNLIDIQNFNTEPVLLFYPHQAPIDELMHKVSQKKPEIDVVTDDGTQHVLWKCHGRLNNMIREQFRIVGKCYIADGHHRSEASKVLAQERRKTNQKSSGFEYFLSVLFPDNQLKIMEYNRVIKKIPRNKSENDLLKDLAKDFTIFPIVNPYPAEKKTFSMYLNSKWHGLKLKDQKSSNDESSIINSIDSYLLTKYCLDPIFEIKDIRKSDNIDFIGGIRGHEEIEKRCREDSEVGFLMYPVQISEIMNVATNNLIMPPKSTWFEPKPRSGIVIRSIL